MTKTPNRMIVSTILFAFTAIPAFAGPDWDEGAKDAGPTPGSAQTVSGTTNTGVTNIRGSTSLALVGAPDLVDLLLVKTGLNPYAFKVDMNMVTGGAPLWQARLTIFQKKTLLCDGVLHVVATPIATVSHASATSMYPILDGARYFANFPATRLGDLLSANSEYYVAVSGRSNLPQGVRDYCLGTPIETMFPDAASIGMTQASSLDSLRNLTQWLDSGSAQTGQYEMSTAGIVMIPASTCASPVFVTGAPVTKSFDLAFAPTISGGPFFCAPSYTISKEFYFYWTPGRAGAAEVTTCGMTAADTGLEVFAIDSCSPDECTAAEGVPLACNDQCGSGNSSRVTFAAEAGRSYLVRLTRLVSSGNQTGEIQFLLTGSAPSGDINGDGIVDGLDMAILLGQWGTSGG